MLTIIQVGDNKASNTYIRNKIKAIEWAGLKAEHIHLPESAGTEDVIEAIDGRSTAVIVQLPIPAHIDKEAVLRSIAPWQDIDGLIPGSPYKPLTPCAIMRWLREKGVNLEGKSVTVLGRSELVGKPLANLLIDAGATVTVLNSHTPELRKNTSCIISDIVISAVGKPCTITEEDVRVTGNQLFIDVGINRDENGKLCGDISPAGQQAIVEAGSEYTPVPGGVGKWTVRELVLRLKEMEGVTDD
jgi:methylenetetrahydrofolate dehydrogenase (NADP+)/methenyltetrahydrofolate cyclohydrolase